MRRIALNLACATRAREGSNRMRKEKREGACGRAAN